MGGPNRSAFVVLVVTLGVMLGALASCGVPDPDIDLDGEGEGEGEGGGEGEGEEDIATVVASFCAVLVDCNSTNAADCETGVTDTFDALADKGAACAEASDLLIDFYVCARGLACADFEGPRPTGDDTCGAELDAADAAIAANGCFD